MDNLYTESFGAIPSPYDIRDYRIKLNNVATAQDPIWNTLANFSCANLPTVRNQGAVGSCVAHALAAICEYFYEVEHGKNEPMSTSWIYGNRRNSTYTGTGMVVSWALKNLLHYGSIYKDACPNNIEVPDAIDYFEERYPLYAHSAEINRIRSYYRLKTEEEIKASLYLNGPILAVLPIYTNHRLATVGTEKVYYAAEPKGTTRGGHAVIIYGWSPLGWRFQNSWGATWGNDGRAILPYDTEFSEFWACEDETSGQTLKEAELNDTIKSLTNEVIALQGQLAVLTSEWMGRLQNLQSQFNDLKETNADTESANQLLHKLLNELEDYSADQEEQIQFLNRTIEELRQLNENLTNGNKELIKELQLTVEKFRNELAVANEEIEQKQYLIDRYEKQIEECPYTILKKNWTGIRKGIALIINWIVNLTKGKKK